MKQIKNTDFGGIYNAVESKLSKAASDDKDMTELRKLANIITQYSQVASIKMLVICGGGVKDSISLINIVSGNTLKDKANKVVDAAKNVFNKDGDDSKEDDTSFDDFWSSLESK
jgi:hypothetical protein